MTLPKMTDNQRERLGKLIWQHVDGVTRNVNQLIGAINADPMVGIKVVAVDEWEKCVSALHTLQDLARQLEEKASDLSVEHLLPRLREFSPAT